MATPFNIVACTQSGRLQYEAVLLAASLRAMAPGFPGTLYLAEPQPGPLWPTDPRVTDPATRALLGSLGAVFLPFESRVFGATYPQGNKIEALATLPDAPFLFLDTDTLILGPIDAVPFNFARPSASMRRENTWPAESLYGPTPDAIWRALHDRFGIDFEASLDTSWPENYWQRYLYLNASWFFHESPKSFGARYLAVAKAIRDDPGAALIGQELDPWLDQIALPLVLGTFGGGCPGADLSGMDGDVTCHWRALPLLYARESDAAVAVLEAVTAPNRVKRVLKDHPPSHRLVYQGGGRTIRAMFDRAALPRREQAIRNAIKREGLWMR